MMMLKRMLCSNQTSKDLVVLERKVMRARTKEEIIDLYRELTATMTMTWHVYHSRQVGRIYKMICDRYLEVSE
jgi:hypothetical protein